MSHAKLEFLELRKRNNLANLEESVNHYDFYRNGHVPRAILIVLAKDLCKKNLHDVHDELLNSILDKCVLSIEEQLNRQVWSSELERRNNLGSIPTQQFNNPKFINLIIELIYKLDTEKFV